MPIYEFYCKKCHMIFNFFSSSVNIEKKPDCPKCGQKKLERQMSVFSSLKHKGEEEDMAMPDIDESKMEQAMNLLANLMRKLTDMTGLDLGPGMEEALARMEAGEDPEQIEAEMGDLLENEDPFTLKQKSGRALKNRPPAIDDQLYYL
jgi:putative FmdB family regulatory protein